MIPDNCRYTNEHEWVRVEDGVGTIGITEYAAEQLGDITYVELPAVSDEVTQGDALGEIESVKAVSDVYTPVSGKVVEVNEDLADDPGAINADAYGKGWLCRVKLTDEEELEGLMSAEDYERMLEQDED